MVDRNKAQTDSAGVQWGGLDIVALAPDYDPTRQPVVFIKVGLFIPGFFYSSQLLEQPLGHVINALIKNYNIINVGYKHHNAKGTASGLPAVVPTAS